MNSRWENPRGKRPIKKAIEGAAKLRAALRAFNVEGMADNNFGQAAPAPRVKKSSWRWYYLEPSRLVRSDQLLPIVTHRHSRN